MWRRNYWLVCGLIVGMAFVWLGGYYAGEKHVEQSYSQVYVPLPVGAYGPPVPVSILRQQQDKSNGGEH